MEDELDKLVNLDVMLYAQSTLGKVSLPLMAHFVSGKAVHVQFNNGSYKKHAMGIFLILDMDRVEIIWA